MTWTFNADLGRHSVRVGLYRLSVWQEAQAATPTLGRWVGCSEGIHGGSTRYGFATMGDAQAWCVAWLQERGGGS